MKNKISTLIFGVAVFFFIITFSIGLPIYCRFFYYLQIKPLGIESYSGCDYATIKNAYDEVLNFLTLPWARFGTGVFNYSESGKAHFFDCKILFNLNLIILLTSSAILITLGILNAKKKISLIKPLGLSVGFYSCVTLLTVFVLLAALVSIDFDRAFVIFHTVFFPGKTNWIFNESVDEILKILPETFFMNCAILIASSIIIISLAVIIVQLVKRRKTQKTSSENGAN